jgi:hypothetical protein
MRSRQKLLVFFAFLLAFWIAMMTVMYFATVYPRRHPHGKALPQVSPLEAPAPGSPDAPAIGQ